ncbi:hypothetical protein Vadar_003764 [Vaccinium darrowii]|uniref:Uncharacterized protein n=1 Tax=Vaccinium darrowii TaxID=229202 RepID=A0ACB7XF52_9ERIC|nr:hypothetical protein Vadar_003764 [Vaccinium darrowii]
MRDIQEGECSKNSKLIKVQPSSGNGWLLRSAVATLRRCISMAELKIRISNQNIQVSEVRSMGGRFVLITFPSPDSRDLIINNNIWDLWFSSITPWNGEPAGRERFTWLSCSGIPLHAWNTATFQKIGENWGTLMEIDSNTLKCSSFETSRILVSTTCHQKILQEIHLEVNSQVYPISVIEEDSLRSPWPCPIPSTEVKDDDVANHFSTAVENSNLNQDMITMMDKFFIMHWECNLQVNASPCPKSDNEGVMVPKTNQNFQIENELHDTSILVVQDTYEQMDQNFINDRQTLQVPARSDPPLSPIAHFGVLSNYIGPSFGPAHVSSPGQILRPALQEVDSNLSESQSPRINEKF